MRIVVIGASSGLGRCIAVGLGRRGASVALLARRLDRLERAAEEAGPASFPVVCDITDTSSVKTAIDEAVGRLGGIDALIYTPALGPLAALVDTDAAAWRAVFDTNVIGAAIVTTAVLPHLAKAHGKAIYLSSVSGSITPPWPGLGAYAVSKAALEKLVEAYRAEHPEVDFTRLTVGECFGGEGEGLTGFTDSWDHELAAELVPKWMASNYMSGEFIDVEDLVTVVDGLVRGGSSLSHHSITLAPRSASSS